MNKIKFKDVNKNASTHVISNKEALLLDGIGL